jgi:hypothetical protein
MMTFSLQSPRVKISPEGCYLTFRDRWKRVFDVFCGPFHGECTRRFFAFYARNVTCSADVTSTECTYSGYANNVKYETHAVRRAE